MKDDAKTKKQLISELKDARRRISELEVSRSQGGGEKEVSTTLDEICKKVIDVAPVWFWAANPDATEIYLASYGAKEITGYEPEEFISRPRLWFDLVLDEDRKVVAEANERARREKVTVSFECRIRHKDGSIRWMHDVVIPHCDDEGRLIGVYGFAIDVTERKRAGEALRALKEFNDNVIQSMPTGLIAHDLDLKITLWNQAMEEISGYKAEEVLGKVPYEVFPHLTEQGLDELHKGALEGQVLSRTNIPYHTPKGKSGYASEKYFPLKDHDGKIIGVMGIVEDVTETVRLEREIARLQEELHERKIVEVAKGILMREMELSEAGAYKYIQKKSQNEKRKMSEVARRLIDAFGSEEELGKFT